MMKKISEKQIIALLGIGVGLAAGATVQMGVKLLDKNLDILMRKLNMKMDLTEETAAAAEETAATAEETAAAAEQADTQVGSAKASQQEDSVSYVDDDMFEE